MHKKKKKPLSMHPNPNKYLLIVNNYYSRRNNYCIRNVKNK